MSTNDSSETIGNRTRDLLVCDAVPQPTEDLSHRGCYVNTHRRFEDHFTLILGYEKSRQTEEAAILIPPNASIHILTCRLGYNIPEVLNPHLGCLWNTNLQQDCALLGHYAVSSGNFLPTFRDNLSVTYLPLNL